jgi:hypothetical protein
MQLLNLDSQELLTNDNLQEITSLLKDHYDLLERFGSIFLPENYRLQPWKDLTDDRVYCMLIKGDAMYKLTTLDDEHQQFNAIEAAKRHEEEERQAKKKRKVIVPIDYDDTPEKVIITTSGGDPVLNTKASGTNNGNHRGKKSTESVERRGSRSRPKITKFKLAIPFLRHLSRDELQEFLRHKGVAAIDGFSTEAMLAIIVQDCKLSESSPFEVLPTFVKNFKNRC